jgi:hypothetical protein
MDTKLTLVIEEEIIQKAKLYAKEKNRSLSDLVENYFKSLLNKEDKKESPEVSPIVASLRGSFKLPEDLDYKKELREALEKKHL